MIRHATPTTARRAVARWGGDDASLEPLGVSGSAVWSFRARGGAEPLVLRLVDPAHRSQSDTESELAFTRHLAEHGVPVAQPVAAGDGTWTVVCDGFVASVVTWARGSEAASGAGFDRAWGGAIARLHEASLSYDGPARWEWHDEPWLAGADRLLPTDDAVARAEWRRLRSVLAGLPRSRDAYGTIHGDHGPQNFRYDAATGTIVTFDFANACRHWYAMDVAIALSTLRRDPARERRSGDLLAGYRAVRPIDLSAWPELLRLRVLYVYLSRLDAFGPAPSDAGQRAQLAGFQSLVAQPVHWPLPDPEDSTT